MKLSQVGEDEVLVEGALGRPPTGFYKATVTQMGGFRSIAVFMVGGIDAAAKARRSAEAIFGEMPAVGSARPTLVTLRKPASKFWGRRQPMGRLGRGAASREVMVKIGVKHKKQGGFGVVCQGDCTFFDWDGTGDYRFLCGTAWGFAGYCWQQRVDCQGRMFRCGLVSMGGRFSWPAIVQPEAELAAPVLPPLGQAVLDEPLAEVRLIEIAHARSGDKGDDALIAVLARKPEYVPYIAPQSFRGGGSKAV